MPLYEFVAGDLEALKPAAQPESVGSDAAAVADGAGESDCVPAVPQGPPASPEPLQAPHAAPTPETPAQTRRRWLDGLSMADRVYYDYRCGHYWRSLGITDLEALHQRAVPDVQRRQRERCQKRVEPNHGRATA